LKPNIFFLLIDSLRADKFYGDKKTASTPTAYNLLKKGIYFEQTISSSDYTVTGIGSIFSGLYPIDAGKRGTSYHKIYSNILNYIDFFKKNGYHSYATMEESFTKLGFSDQFENNDQAYPRTMQLFNGLGEKIIEMLESNRMKKPWIYFVHIDDLHIPVNIPPKYGNLKYSDRYDIMISEIDSWIKKFLKLIDFENTIIVITADHGDYIPTIDDSSKLNPKLKKQISKLHLKKNLPSLIYKFIARTRQKTVHDIRAIQNINASPYEKRSLDNRVAKNRYLYDDVVHVPLLFVGYSIPPTGLISQEVRSIDIFPTLAEIVELPSRDVKIDGRSLVPLFNKQKLDDLPTYLESTIFDTLLKSAVGHRGIRTSKYKYFRKLDDPNQNVHLFDLENDPLEEQNIATTKPDVVEKMEKTMNQIIQKSTKIEPIEMSDDETKEVEAELKKLGYI